MYNYYKMIKVNAYLDLINKILDNNFDSSINDYSLQVNNIDQYISYIKSIEEFSVAVFVMRNIYRKKIYDNANNISHCTLMFRTFNYVFFRILHRAKDHIYTKVEINEEEIIRLLLFSSRFRIYKKSTELIECSNYSAEDVNAYFKRIEEISVLNEDMHSYKISQYDLSAYMKSQRLTEIDLLKKGISLIEEQSYIGRISFQLSKVWNTLLCSNLSDPSDDIIILDTIAFMKLNMQIINFINKFEAQECENPSDEESELIFAYKTESYVYISKFCLSITQEIIEKFISWGQYDNLISYYFDVKRNELLLKSYNKLMTYKIADLLFKSQYIIPMEKKTVNNQKLQVPLIEIKNYICKEESRVLGDIDIIFYSPHTNTMYIVEYKNYQMFITGNQKIESEIAKINREKTTEKLLKRKNYINHHKEKIISDFWGNLKYGIEIDNCNIKAIILTTKPNFYFFCNKSEEYKYYDWIDFKKNIEKHQL